ncbi:hypothetical protein PS862_02840 [Pseudomonas fluorescens]|uniref:Uncharacterized protein n=1 Tax=Pseudomonas fluorescens TaxID=294 RepID=A0A5E7KLY3_PSEFL|nr:hypothetical protein PS862_02840 [Pseudomonas fluorescens]
MHNLSTPGNTRLVVTLSEQSENVSRLNVTVESETGEQL